jgi:hypothetical protein
MNIRKFVVSSLLLVSLTAFSSVKITDSGMYAARVKSMPFLKFWNRPKIAKMIAEFECDPALCSILPSPDNDFPMFMTTDKKTIKRLQELSRELEVLGCELDVYELTIIVDDNDPLAVLHYLAPLARAMKRAEQELASAECKDDMATREAMMRALEHEIAENVQK